MNHFVQQTNLHYVLPYFYFHLFAMVIIIRKMCDQWISYGTETCQSGFFVIRLFYIRSVACLRGGRFYLVIVILDSCDAENLYFSRLLINNLLLRFIFFFNFLFSHATAMALHKCGNWCGEASYKCRFCISSLFLWSFELFYSHINCIEKAKDHDKWKM